MLYAIQIIILSSSKDFNDLLVHINADKSEYICFLKRGDMSTLNGDDHHVMPYLVRLNWIVFVMGGQWWYSR